MVRFPFILAFALGVALAAADGSAVAEGARSTSSATAQALPPEDLGPAEIDVSAYPEEFQRTYDELFIPGRVPGPFLRVREGDTLELTLDNPKGSLMPHNIDLHAVTGPGGGAAIVDFSLQVPGNYALVDHAIFRLEKGAVGTLKVEGAEAPAIYSSGR